MTTKFFLLKKAKCNVRVQFCDSVYLIIFHIFIYQFIDVFKEFQTKTYVCKTTKYGKTTEPAVKYPGNISKTKNGQISNFKCNK